MPLPPDLLQRLPLRTPSTHYRRPDGEPLCGQRSATGQGRARTRYTTVHDDVTCSKCARSLAKADPATTADTTTR